MSAIKSSQQRFPPTSQKRECFVKRVHNEIRANVEMRPGNSGNNPAYYAGRVSDGHAGNQNNLISISVAEVLCKRGVIKEESLESIKFAGTHLRRIKEGSCRDPKVNRLASWMRDGLLEALRNNHLQSLILEIHGDCECTSLLEMYRFDVHASAGISISRQDKLGMLSQQTTAQICLDKDSIKLGTQSLLRKIKAIVETFEDGDETSKIPEDHYLAMKMVYLPSEELESFRPPGFAPFEDEELSQDNDNDATDMEIGSLRTEHHSLCVRMKHRTIGKSRASPYSKKSNKSQKDSKSIPHGLLENQNISNESGISSSTQIQVCSQEETCKNEMPFEKKLLVSVPADPIHQIREWSPAS